MADAPKSICHYIFIKKIRENPSNPQKSAFYFLTNLRETVNPSIVKVAK